MGSQSSKFLPDAIHGSPLSHAASSRDERTQLTDNTSVPYCWTCRLVIETLQGKKYTSNGFKLNLGSSLVDKQVIVTTAHSVYIEGTYARKITIVFPNDKEPVIATTQQLWAAPEYVTSSNPKYDYGIILLLPGESDAEGFGWTTLLTNQELMGRPLSMCGYPSDDSSGSLNVTAGGVESVTNYHIQFMQDSLGTGSGSPVYTWYKGYWTIVGIQGFGGVYNTVIRLTPQVMFQLLQAIDFPMAHVIQPLSLPNVYLQIDSSNTTITCSHTQGMHFMIVPLQNEPNSTNNKSTNTTLPATVFKGLYLYESMIGGSALQQQQKSNGFSLDLLYLIHENNDGSVSFESWHSEGMFLSISDEEDSVLIKQTFVSKKSKPSPPEKFILTAKFNNKNTY